MSFICSFDSPSSPLHFLILIVVYSIYFGKKAKAYLKISVRNCHDLLTSVGYRK
ncbi:unnamed protein product [Hymenolepis diminuta]|uniref:Uncharacterized protein n=1 Tax=Hymenolepis diminuta TaxID=6216 RepID=A0A564ZA60_HYMDI|nr:unnamed protein product [Hymenolepis diminuta]